MSRKRKPKTITGMILTMIFAPCVGFIKYVLNFKPAPLVGRKRGRKKKSWI